MQILVKFPTRGRPENFFRAFDLYHERAEDLHSIQFQVTIDQDDPHMNEPAVLERLSSYPGVTISLGHSRNKVHAINRDLLFSNWDILLLASDDMIPAVQGYDAIIREKMRQYYPDTDGVLWFNDGNRSDLNTLSILGRKYYQRFGYIYYPGYQSMYCDKEFTLVADRLGKHTFLDQVIIHHEHPSYGYGSTDAVHHLNDLHKNADLWLFLTRQSRRFDFGNPLANKIRELVFRLRCIFHSVIKKRKHILRLRAFSLF